jgi:translation elongation factor EF-G
MINRKEAVDRLQGLTKVPQLVVLNQEDISSSLEEWLHLVDERLDHIRQILKEEGYSVRYEMSMTDFYCIPTVEITDDNYNEDEKLAALIFKVIGVDDTFLCHLMRLYAGYYKSGRRMYDENPGDFKALYWQWDG